ncbi:ATP-binding protein [Paraburkholderia bannensis]|uniref:ATP-binding protein n=1 Tax=Paraburkholderia bannensis TaxID=765414 RepID=UPI002AB6AC66|nr:ATP-binding protein [Paraburkholderia bannensis]
MTDPLMRRFISSTLGQIVAIIVCSTSLTFAIFILLLWHSNGQTRPPWPWPPTYRIASVTRLLANTPIDARSNKALSLQSPGFSLRMTSQPARCTVNTLDDEELYRTLRDELSDTDATISVRSCDRHEPNRTVQVIVRLNAGDTTQLEVRTQRTGPEPPRLTFPFFGSFLLMCIGILMMSAWSMSRVVRPLRHLADKAEAFGHDLAFAPIVEEGALEIRSAAHAFNLMQERITRLMSNRTRMVAAVNHDLRTPLTRMRLQLDTNEIHAVRDSLRKDADLMLTIVSSSLTYLNTGKTDESKQWIDLGLLVATICGDYEAMGAKIRCEVPRQIRCLCRPDGMQRVLANLIDNAIRYGETIVVLASLCEDTIIIDISDDGPGIPDTMLRDVLEPFVRLDPSRGGQPGSVGLGLAIAHEIVRMHNGTLQLFNRRPSGLTARIQLEQSAGAGAANTQRSIEQEGLSKRATPF